MGWNLVIQLVLEMVSILWIREKVLDIYQSAAPKVAYQNDVLYKICLVLFARARGLFLSHVFKSCLYAQGHYVYLLISTRDEMKFKARRACKSLLNYITTQAL